VADNAVMEGGGSCAVASAGVDVRIRLLGSFAVLIDGVPAPERWLRKAKSLVKVLALAPGHRLHREVLAELLWPGRGRDSARNNLHQEVHAGVSLQLCKYLRPQDQQA
jgi:hypothetical protein